jgi:phosphate transport system substrate-binding protein
MLGALLHAGDIMGRLLIAGICACVAAVSPALAEPLTGAGSTSVFPLLSHWGQKFQASEESGSYVAVPTNGSPAPESGLGSLFGFLADGVDYEPVGSLGGTMRAIARAVDFGASERPMSAEEVDRHWLMQFPITTGGIAVVVNLPGVTNGTLRLSGAVLADIYLGSVTTWSHPTLRALNPDLALPDAPIEVIHRSDGSGTTYNFAAYLAPTPAWSGGKESESIPSSSGQPAPALRAVAASLRPLQPMRIRSDTSSLARPSGPD